VPKVLLAEDNFRSNGPSDPTAVLLECGVNEGSASRCARTADKAGGSAFLFLGSHDSRDNVDLGSVVENWSGTNLRKPASTFC